MQIKTQMRLRSPFYHTVNRDRCVEELKKQCKSKLGFILTAELIQTLPYSYKIGELSYSQESYIKKGKIIMHARQKREL